MEKYSKAVSERYSQFEKREAHPMEKYVGRHVTYRGEVLEVVGYTTWLDGLCSLIVDASKIKSRAWDRIGAGDVVFKKCEDYLYADINDLID